MTLVDPTGTRSASADYDPWASDPSPLSLHLNMNNKLGHRVGVQGPASVIIAARSLPAPISAAESRLAA
ncbi:hypothetical protein DPEC_G00349330 [Dallia pectoralis]|uniref:Uncharacterized protein n=1 Tax=Dallia pectoralis TaxID=75939 RepID=A0ACC2F1F7_DALPE|nr:hypothetical protein DPEC_G00349330 [Dallia pectoralis]